MSTEDKNRTAVQKVLGEPVFIGFSDEVNRIRRNLLVIASIILTYKHSGTEITRFTVFGVDFEHLKPTFVDNCLFLLLLYAFIHFLLHSWDAVQEWRIRITGTRLSYITEGTWGHAAKDTPNDPRQSTLMTWWTEQASILSQYGNLIDDLKADVKNLDDAAKSKDLGELPNVNNIIQQTTELNSNLNTLRDIIENTKRTIESQRIPVSLERFEKWFRRFSWSQLTRFFLLEWGLPIGLSLWALSLIFPWKLELFSPWESCSIHNLTIAMR